jgi:hypothetical protein
MKHLTLSLANVDLAVNQLSLSPVNVIIFNASLPLIPRDEVDAHIVNHFFAGWFLP